MTDTGLKPLKIELAIKYSEFFAFSFYIKKSNGEFVEISLKTSGLKNSFLGYKDKGLDFIYLMPDHYDEVITKLKEVIKQSNNFKDVYSDLNQIFTTVQQQMIKLGFNECVVDKCLEVNTLVVQYISMIPSLAAILAEVKLNNKSVFYQYVLKSFVAINMLEAFDWNSDIVKNTIGQACLLMDINLTDDDLKLMTESPKDKWPEHIINHPIINSNKIRAASDKISIEVLKIIELHHEVPNEDGYPRGVGPQAIPLLASLVIVSELFCFKILNLTYKLENKEEIVNDLNYQFSKGIFRTAKDLLIKIIA